MLEAATDRNCCEVETLPRPPGSEIPGIRDANFLRSRFPEVIPVQLFDGPKKKARDADWDHLL
jgi:hypothetical protein